MKVKIIKCSGEDFWYRNKIGKIYNVVECNWEKFKIIKRYPAHYISKEDCEEIK